MAVFLLMLFHLSAFDQGASLILEIILAVAAGLGGSLLLLPLLEHILGLQATLLLLAVGQVLAIQAIPDLRRFRTRRPGGYKF